MARSYTNLLYHIVFSTKERHPWLDASVQDRLYEYLGGIIRGEGGIPMGVNGTADHVHILAKLPQTKAVSEVMRALKANSSGWIHEQFPALRDFAWQGGYGAFTVSRSQAPKVQEYLAHQEEHHRKLTFREEFIAFLKAHEIEFEEQYLWE